MGGGSGGSCACLVLVVLVASLVVVGGGRIFAVELLVVSVAQPQLNTALEPTMFEDSWCDVEEQHQAEGQPTAHRIISGTM